MSQDNVARLIEALSDADSDRRFKAANALNDMGVTTAEAVPALVNTLLSDHDSDVREVAALALAEIGPSAEKALQELLGSNQASARAVGAEGLARWDRLSKNTVALLVAALEDSSANVRIFACMALTNGTSPEDAPTDAFVRLLDDENDAVRMAAVDALAAHDEFNLAQLAGAAEHEDECVRARSILALGDLGEESSGRAFSTVLGALGDPAPRVRAAAAEALRYFGAHPEEAVAALGRALHDKDDTVRSFAASSLQDMGPVAQAVVGDIIEALKDTDDTVRLCAAGALANLATHGADVRAALAETLEDPDEGVRAAAAEALKLIDARSAGQG